MALPRNFSARQGSRNHRIFTLDNILVSDICVSARWRIAGGKSGTDGRYPTPGQLQRHTQYAYDADGRLQKTTYADGTFELTGYDNNGNRTSFQDRGGHVTSYFYDGLNRLTKTQFADGSYTQTVYNPDGTVQTSYDALRNATNYGYDDAGRRTSVTDAMNKLTTFGYDNVGNQTSVLDANQHQTQFVYDKLGRKTSTVYPDQTTDTTHYDSLGRVDYKLDQTGVRTDYGYDGDGRLTSVTQYLNFGQANQQALVTQYGYDEVGNRISQTDANQHTTKYVYDQLGRRISRVLPAGQSESYSYDAVGNLQQKIDFNGKTTTYAYDSNNRLQSKTPDPSFSAPAVGFTYSATGKRLTMSDVSGETTYTYDPQTDRLLHKQTPEGTLTYTYDSAGNLKSLQSQNQNGASDAYTYDADNRLATVTDASGQTTYAYDNVGNLQSFAYPNGVATAYTYDTLNRLTQMGAGKNGTLQANYVYTLGAAGNRLSVAELSGRTVNYGYDSLYRLTSEQVSSDPHGNNGTGAYTYDNVGNRLTLNSSLPPAGMMNYTYDADDRLGSDQYDPNGNTINSLAVANTYDFENHLVQHGTQPGAVTIVYDGDGNRVSETVGGVTTNYLVDTQNPTGYVQVVDELQNGAVTRTYSWGLELISKLETGNSKRSFYGFDGHGSVRFLTDSPGAVTDTYDYDAFGNLINSTGSTANNYLFAGEQYDPALGLYYNRARYLNATTGRFWTMDTYAGGVSEPLSLHRYLFASANPVNRVDPSGLEDLASISAAEGISEDLDATAAEEDFAAKRALSAKIFDAYFVVGPSNFRSIANIPIVHAFIYMDTVALGEGTRYDVGLDLNAAPFSSAIFGVGEGFVQRSPESLASIKAAAFTFSFKVASLNALQRLAWEGTVQALPVDTSFVSVPYSIVNMLAGTNCVKWSVEAAIAAVVASRVGN